MRRIKKRLATRRIVLYEVEIGEWSGYELCHEQCYGLIQKEVEGGYKVKAYRILEDGEVVEDADVVLQQPLEINTIDEFEVAWTMVTETTEEALAAEAD